MQIYIIFIKQVQKTNIFLLITTKNEGSYCWRKRRRGTGISPRIGRAEFPVG
jgi:hypothetical protein